MITIVEWCEKHDKLKRLHQLWSKENTRNPREIDFYTKELFYFKCNNGHKLKARPYNAIKNKNLCPYCSRKRVSSNYNLKTIFPKVAKEWNYEKNGNLKPEEILPSIGKKVWWICEKGHEWEATVNSRSRGTNCPYCSHNFPSEMINLKVLYPEVIKNWDYERNDIPPENYLPYSTKKVWWICNLNQNHHYEKCICNAIKKPYGCPICRKEIGTSFPEQAIYYYLKKVFKDCQNRVKIENKEFDIYIPSLNFVIEYDGIRYHENEQSKKNDQIKNNILKEHTIDLLRIIEQKDNAKESYLDNNILYCYVNREYQYLNAVIQDIFKYINQKYHKNLTMKIDIGQDSLNIYSEFLSLKKEKSLLSNRPELIEEWDYEKNKGINPEFISPYSRIKLWWKCKNGHSWEASANNRSIHHNCPYCCNQKISYENSFAAAYPELIKYWHKTKNELGPENVSPKSGKTIWWECNKGHSFKKTVRDFTESTRCPICYSRNYKRYEKKLNLIKYWNQERNQGIDFFSIIEDENSIWWWTCKNGHGLQKSIHTMLSGIKCPLCKKGRKSFAEKNPQLIPLWNKNKNLTLTPYDVGSGSGKRVWWICEKGHEWQERVYEITKGNRCPYCSNHRASIESNLAVDAKELLEEWNYEKNIISPTDIKAGSKRKVWWKCKQGHVWQATVSNRSVLKEGCPFCSKRKPTNNYNLEIIHKEILKYWNYKKNDKKPNEYTPKSDQKVWWICDKGHEWQEKICSMVLHNKGCSFCNRTVLSKDYNLKVIYPNITKEWDYQNNDKGPEEYFPKSGKKVWWTCKYGHHWQMRISKRKDINQCPYCKKTKNPI